MHKYNLKNEQLANGRLGKVAILGSGIMGSGIAAAYTAIGIPVVLLDISMEVAEKGLQAAKKSKPALFLSSKDVSLIKLGTFDELELIKDCDMIVEVVIEDLKIKQGLLAKVAEHRKSGSIVCTNTSGISLKAMSEGLPDDMQEHFIGTHFFNPVRYMELLEVISGPKTLPDVMKFICDFEKDRVGKGIVIANDVPGFAGNRIGVQGLTLAMQKMIEHDLTIPEVDALLGSPLGRPKTAIFKTSDLVGLDTASMVAGYLYKMCEDDERRETLVMPEFVLNMIKKGMLGKKTRKVGGFYKTEKVGAGLVRSVIDYKTLEYGSIEKPSFTCLDDAKQAKTVADKVQAIVYGEDKGSAFAKDVIFGQLAYAASMTGIVAPTIVEIDNALKWGYNFSLAHFELWDAIGVKKSVELMEKMKIAVPKKIKDMLQGGSESFYKLENGKKLFYDFESKGYKEVPVTPDHISLFNLKASGKAVIENKSASLIDAGDGVFIFEIHTPPVNALDLGVLEAITKSLDYVSKNGIGLVIGNNNDFFSAGANLGMVMGLIGKKDFKGIRGMAQGLQQIVCKLKYINFPVVAAVYGRALGGGLEMILGCDRVLAHPNSFVGLVEMGVGLVPAGSGTTNLYARAINSVPDAIKNYDLSKFVETVFMNIAMVKFSTSAKHAMELGYFRATDKIVPARANLFSAAKKEVINMVEDGYAPPSPKPIRVMGQDGFGMLNAGILAFEEGNFIAPHAAKVARGLARILTGGDTGAGMITEQQMLDLEADVFTELCKDRVTVEKIVHMLTTGKPLLK
jgi:3-hydroxyacyl-CoA dehydrogenase